ncbi:hypothetical protein EDB83DRAFT_1749353 [Lactarius deliciosus]|nr:hypothetical protein EDB83DRAFT_1749353 [Lactarius deliciosus]
MRQHYLRAGHGSHRFAHLILLPAHVQMFLNPERTNLRSSFQTRPTRVRTVSSPAFQRSLTRSTHAPAPAPPSPQRIMVSTAQTFELSSPRLARQQQPQPHCRAHSQLSVLPHDATCRQHVVRRPSPCGVVWHARHAEGARTCSRARHGCACARLLGALGNMGAGLELSLKGPSDEVLLKVLYKQVGLLLPNVQALRTLRLQTMMTEAAQAEEDPSHLVL